MCGCPTRKTAREKGVRLFQHFSAETRQRKMMTSHHWTDTFFLLSNLVINSFAVLLFSFREVHKSCCFSFPVLLIIMLMLPGRTQRNSQRNALCLVHYTWNRIGFLWNWKSGRKNTRGLMHGALGGFRYLHDHPLKIIYRKWLQKNRFFCFCGADGGDFGTAQFR